MQALILAGGLGTRLRAIVTDRPKPMVEICNKPFIEYQIEHLKKHDVTDIILCVGYMHEKIESHFEDGRRWGVKLRYSVEEALMGTGGAVKLAEKHIEGAFFLLNGDTFFNTSLKKLFEFHKKKIADHSNTVGTLALTKVEDASRFGSIGTNSEGRIKSFDEKNKKSKASNLINAGIYVLERNVFDFIPPRQKISLERETFQAVLRSGFALFGRATGDYFVDIGTPEGYYDFEEFLKGR